MTFYVILKKTEKDWECITDPDWYISAKKKMGELKKENPKYKFKLMKTSY